jgi:hypothetical protein
MVDKSRRAELMREYADRKPPNGVYAVRCGPSGETWVAWSKNVDKRWNALLAMGNASHPLDRAFQAALAKHGPESFTYEVLQIVEETDAHTLATLLPERAAVWRAKLSAGEMRGF